MSYWACIHGVSDDEDCALCIKIIENTQPKGMIDLIIASQRKSTPIYSGVIKYFPDALAAVARCSYVGNEQHNPGSPLHWDRSKSGDELDALVRHLMNAGEMDTDGIRHSTKVCWRALAHLQKELEGQPNESKEKLD